MYAIFLSRFSVIALSLVLIGVAGAQEQKLLFCAESMSYSGGELGELLCKTLCEPHSDASCLKTETSQGWQITATSPKEVPYDAGGKRCRCIGIQYVLNKVPANIPAANPEARNRLAIPEKGYAVTSSGHNGISFDMTQKQVEAKGFACSPPEKNDPDIIAECTRVPMVGVAFGLPTKNYRVSIGRTKRVDIIEAEFSGNITKEDYLGLHKKIEFTFPTKDQSRTSRLADSGFIDEWKANNKARLVLRFVDSIKQITKPWLQLEIYSPRVKPVASE